VAQKARQFYKLARTTLPESDRRSMSTAEMMGSVYWRLLRKLERREFRVFGGKAVRLGKPEKLWVMASWWLRAGLGGGPSDYGAG
jgi:phytoene/squalene synthetase